MKANATARWLLTQEARALLMRLSQVRPFALQETMLPAAALSSDALVAIERVMAEGRRELEGVLRGYVRWLHGPEGRQASPARMQRGFTLVRLRFNMLLSQLDVFSDVLAQRSEHETGVRLAGLDVLATDGLRLRSGYYEPPPVMCYLDRGHGAAIRRARTRLPGGGDNPVAIIRVPRERMVGSGIGSSLLHEVGHQAAWLLDVLPTLAIELRRMQAERPDDALAWTLFDRWISEIVADFWSVALLGIGSTLGLMAVVSLPRAFVFRVNMDDPHPFPWIRVRLSCAMGRALHPHPQWTAMSELWRSFYPTEGLDSETLQVITVLEDAMDEFVELLARHRTPKLRGATLAEVLPLGERTPALLAGFYEKWRSQPQQMRTAPATLVFAALGQARANGRITPEAESRLIVRLLTDWALRRALGPAESAGDRSGPAIQAVPAA
jgi:hypothetical protein